MFYFFINIPFPNMKLYLCQQLFDSVHLLISDRNTTILSCCRLPNSMHTICSDKRCSMAIKLSYLLPFIICSPTFLVFEILETNVIEHGKMATLYHLGLSSLARVNHELLYMVHLWTYAVIIKLLPCLILTVVTISLVSVTNPLGFSCLSSSLFC